MIIDRAVRLLAMLAGLLALASADARPLPMAAACQQAGGAQAGGRTADRQARFVLRSAEVACRLKAAHYDVILFGDSIMRQWPAPSLRQTFPGRRVLNAGIGGDETSDLLAWLDGKRAGSPGSAASPDWSTQEPRLIILMIGSNDVRRGASASQVAAGVIAAARRVHGLYPQAALMLLDILPRGAGQGDFVQVIKRANQAVRLWAEQQGPAITFADAHSAMHCEAADCGLYRPPDYIHLTPAGYDRLSQLVRTQMTR